MDASRTHIAGYHPSILITAELNLISKVIWSIYPVGMVASLCSYTIHLSELKLMILCVKIGHYHLQNMGKICCFCLNLDIFSNRLLMLCFLSLFLTCIQNLCYP